MRIQFSKAKSQELRRNPKRGIGFDPEQYRAIGWVGDRLFTVIFEIREDRPGEYWRLVTLWRSTRKERELYEANS